MQDKSVALVTGANRGIGPPFAKDRAAHGLVGLVAPGTGLAAYENLDPSPRRR